MKKLTQTQKNKNRNTYKQIRKVYDRLEEPNISYKQFKRRTMSRMAAEGTSALHAAKREANTETFVSAAERSRTNLINSLKENFKEEYQKLRNLSRDAEGRFMSVKDNLTWDKDRKGYYLQTPSGNYFINVDNSPETISILDMTTGGII